MPIYNIFKRTKRKKSKQKPIIVADVHEKNSLIIAELHENKNIDLEIKSLKIGDYLIGKTIIERKTVQDFISSMINKRLVQQLRQMKKYKQQLLIIEGYSREDTSKKPLGFLDTDTKLNPNAIRGFILSIIRNYQTPIIFTQDYKDTVKYLIILAKQQLKPKTEITLHHRIPKKIQEQKQYVLEAFPNIGPVTAKKLLKKFKTINNILNATEQELQEVLKSKTKNFKKLLVE